MNTPPNSTSKNYQTRHGNNRRHSVIAGVGAIAFLLCAVDDGLTGIAPSFPTDGLVSWYKADGDALDSVGSNNGALEAGVGFAPGEVGSAFLFNGNFDGLAGGVNLGNVTDFNFAPSDSFTISAWFNCFGTNAATSNGDTQDGQQIVCLNYGCTDPLTAQVLSVGRPGGPLSFLVRDINGTAASLSATNVPPIHAWHLGVGTRDGTAKTIALYLDGVLVGSTSDPTTTTLASGVADLIGRRNACNSFNVFYGMIDDVRIYNRALSANEVLALYNYGTQISLSNAHTNDGLFIASVSGVVSNQTVVFQSAPDLTNWTSFQTNVGTGGILNFTNSLNPAIHNTFFRAFVP